MIKSWDIKRKLQVWEAAHILGAQRLAQQVCQVNLQLPRRYSLNTLYEHDQGTLTTAVAEFAQRGDLVAKEVLGIIRPVTKTTSPRHEQVEHFVPFLCGIDAKAIFKNGGQLTVIDLASVTFIADRYLADGEPTSYIIGTAFLLNQTPELERIAQKLVLVGFHTDERPARQRMEQLRDRLITPQFIEELGIKGQMALLEIREFPAAAGAVETLFNQILGETSLVIKWMITAAEQGVLDSGAHVGMVRLGSIK